VIRLSTLGVLDLQGAEGQELRTVLAQPKRAALLAYLAVALPRGLHRRDPLLALFWPEYDAERARNALSQAIHFLRRSLGDAVFVRPSGEEIGLDRTAFWCDAVAFEEALDAGRPAEALELYRGDLLDGFHVSDAPEFERWVGSERERLAQRWAAAVEELATERERAGDFTGAAARWRRLAARDPYSSRIALRLMGALAAAGDAAAALQHARIHETLLREELQAMPDPEVAALVRQLQSPRVDKLPASRQTPAPVEVERSPAGAGATSPSGDLDRPAVASGSRDRSRRRRATIMAAGLVAVFATVASAVALRNGSRVPSITQIRSLAVLPLENLSGDSVHRSFAAGMHDALITELARIPSLSVISRTSVVQYQGTKKRLPDIARELKVDGVIEGTLVWEGGRVRMNAQLVHGPSDRHLWAKSYTRDLRAVLLLQAELAEEIARELRVATAPHPRPPRLTTSAADSLPRELRLRELYLRGRHAEISRSLAGLQTAKEYHRLAIERDSTFALAYAGLADVHGHLGDYSYAPLRPSLDTARMMAQRAVALDSNLPEARTALAVTLADAHRFADAEREFLRAIQLSPSNALAHFRYSVLLVGLGRGHEALREAQRAQELDPFAPRGVPAMVRYARWLITGDRADMRLNADERRSPVLKVEPGEPWARSQYAHNLAEEGRCSEAHMELQRAQQLAPDNLRMLPNTVGVYWRCGERGRARALVRAAERRPDADDNGYRIAMAYAMFGEKDAAFAWLDRQWFTMGELSGLSADRKVDALRSDPRFAHLLRRIGVRSR
jgi:DNA-binding SARP family transcriptional activator/TolB-like protein/Flp pilus assembly protein TadD